MAKRLGKESKEILANRGLSIGDIIASFGRLIKTQHQVVFNAPAEMVCCRSEQVSCYFLPDGKETEADEVYG